MYPAYQTFKALDTKDKDAQAQMLRYWAVFAAFASVEFYTDMLVSWLPFYYELKMLMLLYLSTPFTKGSATVYEMHMKPWLRAHETEIDEAVSQAKSSLLAVVVSYRDRLASWAHISISTFLQAKLPAMVPLYTMLVALITETMAQLFVSPPASPSSSLSSSAADIPAPSVDVSAPTQLSTCDVPVEREEKHIPAHQRIVSAPAPSIAHLAHAPISKTTANIITSTNTTTSDRKRREIVSSAPIAAESRSTRSHARKNALVGTAMPARASTTATRPVPTKKEVTAALLEEDCILANSPSKRSNPKLLSSPQRRSAV